MAKFISGKAALENIPIELGGFDSQKPLVLASPAVSDRGLKKKFVKAFYDSGVVLGAFYDRVPDYAGISLISELAKLFRDRGCDSIIAIGGGAVVDVAKGLNILVSKKAEDLLQFAGKDKITEPLKPLAYVPTWSSNGLESAGQAVVDNQSFISDYISPNFVVIDSRMTKGRCTGCVAQTAVSALSTAVEASALSSIPNPISDAYAFSAIQFLYENMRKGIKKPANTRAAMALANAAAYAGVAFSNSEPGMIHLLTRSIRRNTGDPSGKIMGILLPIILDNMLKKNKVRGELLLMLAGFDVYSKTAPKECATIAVEMIKNLLKKIKVLPSSLSELRFPPYLLKEVARDAAGESNKRYSEADCMKVLEIAYKGKSLK
jgi:alcohol dehydrogenase